MGIEPETSSVNKLSLNNNWIIEPFPLVVTGNNRIFKFPLITTYIKLNQFYLIKHRKVDNTESFIKL